MFKYLIIISEKLLLFIREIRYNKSNKIKNKTSEKV